MDNNWEVALRTFYRTDDGRILKGVDETGNVLGESCELINEIGSHEEAEVVVAYLHRTNLIKEATDKNGDRAFELTRDGFEVSHDLIMSDRQYVTDSFIAGFTLVLALTATITAIPQANEFGNPISAVLYGGLVVGIMFLIMYIYYRPRSIPDTFTK